MDTTPQEASYEMKDHSEWITALINVCRKIAFRNGGGDKRPSTQLTVLAESVLEQLASPNFSPFASVVTEESGEHSKKPVQNHGHSLFEVIFTENSQALMQERAEIFTGAMLQIIRGCRAVCQHSDYGEKIPVAAISLIAKDVLDQITNPDFSPFRSVKLKPANK
jgi:hypothetical protein